MHRILSQQEVYGRNTRPAGTNAIFAFPFGFRYTHTEKLKLVLSGMAANKAFICENYAVRMVIFEMQRRRSSRLQAV